MEPTFYLRRFRGFARLRFFAGGNGIHRAAGRDAIGIFVKEAASLAIVAGLCVQGYFNILGHATGRLLLKRPGYEVDFERVIEKARQQGCFLEINSSPDRLDLSAENARHAASAGVMIAVNTDSHSTGELPLIRCGIDQARRAGLEKTAILNYLPWEKLQSLFKR